MNHIGYDITYISYKVYVSQWYFHSVFTPSATFLLPDNFSTTLHIIKDIDTQIFIGEVYTVEN